MAGSYVPARLVGELLDLLEQRMDRQLKRLQEAELDPVIALGAMLQAVEWARDNQTGLLEAMDVLHPQINAMQIVQISTRKDLEPLLKKRLEDAIKPPKRPGLISPPWAFGFGRGRSLSHMI